MRPANATLICLGAALLLFGLWWETAIRPYSAGAGRPAPGEELQAAPVLTLVTEYPFYFKGSAPRRYALPRSHSGERR